jgi:SSS family solute:Na+ symporter
MEFLMIPELNVMNPIIAMALNPIDISILVLYFIGVLIMGFYFATKSKTTEEYFVAGRSYKGWVLGISMLSTTISSITFLAFPAAAFALDWRLAVNYITWPIGMIFAVIFFIPFFRHGRATTAFDYLDDRFGPLACLYGVASFIILELMRLGMVLYLVGLAVSSLTGLPLNTVIIIVGLIIACYTVVGGFEGVIWTDVIQAFILWGGGIACIVLIVMDLPGGFFQIIDVGAANNKFYMGAMNFDLGKRTFWTMFILGVVASIGNFTTSQHVVQRYIAAESTREARKSAIIGALLSVPTWLAFFFIGTALWVYYHVNPNPAVASMEADKVFPYFIQHNFPVGITGIVLAGVFSAAMSSLDSSINALSTVTITNIVRRYLAPDRDEKYYLRWARIIGCICGGIMIAGAILFGMLPYQESVVNLQTIVFSVFGGAFISFFLLGFLTTKVHYAATMIALVTSIIVNLFLALNTLGWLPKVLQISVHAYWVSTIVNTCFIIVAYSVSLIWGKQKKDLDGLTVWTVEKTAS